MSLNNNPSSKNLLFISEVLPIDTYASCVVFYRHFFLLEKAGYNIYILTDVNSYNRHQAKFPSSWKVDLLPNRKWFLPPYSPNGLLQKFRFQIYYELYVRRLIKEYSIDLLIGMIYGEFLSPFCAYVKLKSNLPLINFLHDDPIELSVSKSKYSITKNTTKSMRISDEILIASDGFYKNWSQFSDKFTLLPPIPLEIDRHVKFQQKNNFKELTFGYSGSVYNEVIPYLDLFSSFLQSLNFRLIIIGNNNKAKQLEQKYPNTVRYISLFESSEQANNYILENCNAFLVPYPDEVEKMPWIKTCFPSKFIQIIQLEIPILVIAPTDSAIGVWCEKNNWELFSNSYNEETLWEKIKKIQSNEVNAQILDIKYHEFNPKEIQKKLEWILKKYSKKIN